MESLLDLIYNEELILFGVETRDNLEFSLDCDYLLFKSFLELFFFILSELKLLEFIVKLF